MKPNDEASSTAVERVWVSDAFAFYWDDVDDTILVIEFHRAYDWSEYHLLMKAVYDYIDGRVDEVAYINLMPNGLLLPKGSPLPHMQKMVDLFKDPIIIVVHANQNRVLARFLMMIGNVVARRLGQSLTIERAREMIAKARADA